MPIRTEIEVFLDTDRQKPKRSLNRLICFTVPASLPQHTCLCRATDWFHSHEHRWFHFGERYSYALPGTFHKDPADRVLVATAIHHGFTFITADERILAYPHVMSMHARR